MKTIVQKNSNRSMFFFIKMTALFMLVFCFTVSNAENKGRKGDAKSLKVQLERAEAAYQKNLQKKLLADSLLNLGISIHYESGDEIRLAINNMNNKAKEFTAKRKKLEKEFKDCSTSQIIEIKAAIKELEDDYKLALTAFDDVMKSQIKSADDGTKHIHKGKAFNREVKKSLKYSEKTLKNVKNAMEEHLMMANK